VKNKLVEMFFSIHYLVYYTCEIHRQKETCSVLSNAWMGRRTRTSVTITSALLYPITVSAAEVKADKGNQQKRSRIHYDRTAGPQLTDIHLGEPVYIKPPPTKHGRHWQHGVVTNVRIS